MRARLSTASRLSTVSEVRARLSTASVVSEG